MGHRGRTPCPFVTVWLQLWLCFHLHCCAGTDLGAPPWLGRACVGHAPHGPLQATFLSPMAVALSADDRLLFIADYLNHTVRCLDLASRTVHTLRRPGDQGVVNVVAPSALCLDDRGAIYVACKEDHTIRKLTPVGPVSGVP